MLRVIHRHSVFTLLEELRKYFNFKRVLLIHTFGSDLKWNPHIHALVTECSILEECKRFSIAKLLWGV